MDTHFFTEREVERKWYLVDADQQVLGRLADQIARILIGKNKPEYTPNADVGDFVIVVNAEKVVVTGNKEKDFIYYRHSQYPGGLKKTPLFRMRERKPEYMIRKAVWGMIKHTPLGRKRFKKLKVYTRSNHPHEAQNPITLEQIKN
jgi:large subunit ribosomal protein L13